MLNRRAKQGNRRKSLDASCSQPNDSAEQVAQDRRQKKQDRRIDSIQAAFVSMQN